nr:hypothetical protein [Methylobacterium sp. L1A1]
MRAAFVFNLQGQLSEAEAEALSGLIEARRKTSGHAGDPQDRNLGMAKTAVQLGIGVGSVHRVLASAKAA